MAGVKNESCADFDVAVEGFAAAVKAATSSLLDAHQAELASLQNRHEAEVLMLRGQIEQVQADLESRDIGFKDVLKERDELRQRLQIREAELMAAEKSVEEGVKRQQDLTVEAEDKIRDLEAERELHTQALAAAFNVKTKENSPNDPTNSTNDTWSARVRELVRENPDQAWLSGIPTLWSERWPNDRIENFKPVKHLKTAVQYVTGVEVTHDLKVVFSPGPSTDVKKEEQSQTQPARARSRSPRRTGAEVADMEQVTETLQTITDLLRKLTVLPDAPKRGQNLPIRREAIIKSLASDAWKLDPSRSATALTEWGSSMKSCHILSLRHTHNSVRPTFRHGEHKDEPISNLTNQLLSGEKKPSDITPMVVARHGGGYWVVFGNRRLHALQAAVKGGLEATHVSCIVHELCQATLPFFCSFVCAMTSEEGETIVRAPIRPRPTSSHVMIRPQAIGAARVIAPRPTVIGAGSKVCGAGQPSKF